MTPLTKDELKRQIRKFLIDGDRGISHKMFAELCGINVDHMRDVFMYNKAPLTEMVQTRVNRGYHYWKQGLVRTMQRKDRTVYVDYRKEAKPVFAPKYGLQVKDGKIVMRIGMVNRYDYSERDLQGN
jgi:hypothetical protein